MTEKSENQCEECKLGYYMNDYGKCIKSRSYDLEYFSKTSIFLTLIFLLI